MAPKRAYHHGNLRPALLEAALGLVAEEGTATLSLRAVARAAGVSRAAPYHHFADKEALLAAVKQHGFDQLVACMETEVPTDGPRLDRLEACGQAYIRFAVANPELYRLMFGERTFDAEAYPELANSGRCTFQLLLDQVIGAQGDGTFRPGDPLKIALSIWAGVHGITMLLLDGVHPAIWPDPSEADVAEWTGLTLSAIVHGFCVEPEPLPLG